ncbi:YtpR family tRNA-binding protein [Alkalibacillus sp. S2W]|uniref:YtpR family tRNA-binding protein n=1 Tax=Alkalibacillus sp. S2W TaxID=3386553 RepID=UPI00398CA96B
MQVVYNRQGIGDVLLLTLHQTDAKTIVKEYGDVARIALADSGEAVAYNIFNASNYMDVNHYELLNINQDFVDQVNQIFNNNGLHETLNIDLSPKFVVGNIDSIEQHDDSDKLSVCQVDVGEETLQIVCGAPNVAEGQKVVVAKVGAFMPSGLEIKDSELRGVKSTGMICAARELNLPNAPQEKGILVLSNQEKVGNPFTLSMYQV